MTQSGGAKPMAVFESRYKELGFYVKGAFRSFKNGRYATESKDEIAVLEKLADAKRVDAEEPVKAEESPQPKAKPIVKKKSSDK